MLLNKVSVWMVVGFLVLSAATLGRQARVVRLKEDRTELIHVSPHGTVLSFPSRPSKVILGSKGAFAVEFVNDDLVITALRPTAYSNLYVYVEKERFSFNLKVSKEKNDEIVLVRKHSERKIKVKVKYD